MSFPRKRESSLFKLFWTPVFTGVTTFRLFTTPSSFERFKKLIFVKLQHEKK